MTLVGTIAIRSDLCNLLRLLTDPKTLLIMLIISVNVVAFTL